MAIEYTIILGYAIFSFILIIAASLWETENKEFLPLRVLLLLLGIFLAMKIPGVLNHLVYANDLANQGVLNSTQISNLVRSNELYAKWGVRTIYIILAYFALWFMFFWIPRQGKEVYKEGIAEIGKGENAGFGRNRGKGGKWSNPKWK